MRKFVEIDLKKQSFNSREIVGREISECGRYLIAKMLVEQGIATADPLSSENPLIFSVGPFAGTNFSNANRLSVGCKVHSPEVQRLILVVHSVLRWGNCR